MRRFMTVVLLLGGLWCPPALRAQITGMGTGAHAKVPCPTADPANDWKTVGSFCYDAGGATWDYNAVTDTAAPVGTDDQTAAEVALTPAGNIAAVTVQGAVEELDTEKVATTAVVEIGGTNDQYLCYYDLLSDTIPCDLDPATLGGGAANPAGAGNELQYRFDGTTFGAVAGWSSDGTDISGSGDLTTTGNVVTATVSLGAAPTVACPEGGCLTNDTPLQWRNNADSGWVEMYVNTNDELVLPATVTTTSTAAAELELYEAQADGTGSVLLGVNGNVANSQKECRFTGTDPKLPAACVTHTDALQFLIEGAGSAITTGVKGDIEVPYTATITQATILCDQSGDIVVDVWQDTYDNFPPTDADTITAAAPITVSTAVKAQDATLTGWTTTLTAGNTLRFNVDSAATVTRCTVSLLTVR